MSRTFLDQKAKETLRKSVRGLRARLIDELTEAVKGEYQLDLTSDKAKLPAARREKRTRLEVSLQERARTAGRQGKSKAKPGEIDLLELHLAATEAAHTLLNRLVFLRILEHHELLKPALVSGGWDSPAFAQEFAHYGAEFKDEPSRGYLALLETVYAEYALDLPALFGPVGVSTLFPIPVPTLRAVLEMLSNPELESAWGDDTTLGWVYQFWNDPERERLDEKVAGGGKIEPHELGPKTQMFTERYMVEWLLHNTVGQTWLAMCAKHGWTADFHQVKDRLEERRIAFRKQREAGEVPLDALMRIEDGLEERWKYWVPQPMPPEAIAAAPETLGDLKLLDPACGSGHFLIIAFDLLAALYEEEARHRGESKSAPEIARSILERNLHGIDIDARAIQLSAASLWLKAQLYAPHLEIAQMNLVAPIFRLGALPKDDPSLVRLCNELQRFLVPKEVTLKLVEALSGVDHLGTLLRVDDEVARLLDAEKGQDGPLLAFGARKKRTQVLDRLTDFLDEHAAEADLGLRLEGEQIEAGMRFVGIAKKDRYDIVVGNPPYQGTSKMAQPGWIKKHYPRDKENLYACFLERALELARPGGCSALLTMRGWLFVSQFEDLREHLLQTWQVLSIGDFDRGAFDDVPNEVLAVSATVLAKWTPTQTTSVACQPTAFDDTSYDRDRTKRKRAAVLAQVGRYEFDVKKLVGVRGSPLVYWWTPEFLGKYVQAEKLGEISPAKQGLATADNARFLRAVSEVAPRSGAVSAHAHWQPFIKGGDGAIWYEPVRWLVNWASAGLELKTFERNGKTAAVIRNPQFYFRIGVAFSMLGARFTARLHRAPSVIDVMGSSVYPNDLAATLCLLNSSRSRYVMESLNPSVHFQQGDVDRIPIFRLADADRIAETLGAQFGSHESTREPSVEFKSPGLSPWRYTQAWAQRAVDRAPSEPLPAYEPELDAPDPIVHVSFAIGVALGRFGANGEGTLNDAPSVTLSNGVLYLSGHETLPDSLTQPAAARILDAWKENAPAILQGKRLSLSDWLKKDFFRYHLSLYENAQSTSRSRARRRASSPSSTSTAGKTTRCPLSSSNSRPPCANCRAKSRI